MTTPQDPTPPAAEPDADAIRVANLAIDVIMATSTGVARLIQVTSDDLPRLVLGAACRIVERMANSPGGHAVARTAAYDLRAALAEAQQRTDQLINLIDSPDTPPV